MEQISSLINALKKHSIQHPHLVELTFIQSDYFGWDHTTHVITYDPRLESASAYLLHEFGHALLNHRDFDRDVILLEIERAAWIVAQEYALGVSVSISEDLVEDSLDTYRDWLHARSRCPDCQATGIESITRGYSCPACGQKWRANEARSCRLRRYKTK